MLQLLPLSLWGKTLKNQLLNEFIKLRDTNMAGSKEDFHNRMEEKITQEKVQLSTFSYAIKGGNQLRNFYKLR